MDGYLTLQTGRYETDVMGPDLLDNVCFKRSYLPYTIELWNESLMMNESFPMAILRLVIYNHVFLFEEDLKKTSALGNLAVSPFL